MTIDIGLDAPDYAKEAGLVYVSDQDPGIRRVKAGKGFAYRDAQGRAVKDAATLDRIETLAIPPAWTDVWISPRPKGHIQATGRDRKGRKQYRYHPDWSANRGETKFARMAAFGRALPALRKAVEKDLARPGLPREKVLAAVVQLLELTLIRIGNDEYARANKSFGLTTLRKRHVDIHGAEVAFAFRGKSGKDHETGVHDRRLARVVRLCEDLPGQWLFQYVGEDGARHKVESHDVNAYIRDASGGDFTAKDFRTWAGTVHCAQELLAAEAVESEAQAKRLVTACVKRVAGRLGNTPTVCRKSYIHPAVIDAFAEGRLETALGHRHSRDFEKAVLAFLEGLDEDAKAA